MICLALLPMKFVILVYTVIVCKRHDHERLTSLEALPWKRDYYFSAQIFPLISVSPIFLPNLYIDMLPPGFLFFINNRYLNPHTHYKRGDYWSNRRCQRIFSPHRKNGTSTTPPGTNQQKRYLCIYTFTHNIQNKQIRSEAATLSTPENILGLGDFTRQFRIYHQSNKFYC